MSQLRVGYDIRLLSNSAYPSGVGRYALELLNAMAHFAEIVLFSNRQYVVPGLEAAKVIILPQAPFWQQTVLPNALVKSGVQVFHSLAFTLPFWLPIPSVVTIHDLGFATAPETMAPQVVRYLHRMVPRSVRHANRIIADSLAVRDELRSIYRVPEHKIARVHLGVGQEYHDTGNLPRENVESMLNIRRPYLLAVGTQEPRKNFVRLLEAFAHLSHSAQPIPHQLILVGSFGVETERIRSSAKRLDIESRVEMRGYVPQDLLPLYYRGADAFIYPSLFEGFGLPIIEAMATGCPVVTSNRSCMPEVAGEAAVYIDPLNVHDMALGITTALREHDRLSELGQSKSSEYSWKRTAEETLAVYREAWSGH